MGLFKKKSLDFNLWDGQKKPVEWYFSDAGKAAFDSAFENLEEMCAAINESNWMLLILDVCHQTGKKPPKIKKNWLLKYFYEYVSSKNLYGVGDHTLILMTAMASVRSDETGQFLFPYPDCLDEEKNPILYYFNHVKPLFPIGTIHLEDTYPIVKTIVHYIYNAFLTHDKDASRESWMYDKSFYFDYKGERKDFYFLKEKLLSLVEFPDCLPN